MSRLLLGCSLPTQVSTQPGLCGADAAMLVWQVVLVNRAPLCAESLCVLHY